MTNSEKYLKDGVNIEEIAKDYESFCNILKENDIVMTYKQKMREFLKCEIEVTLTDDERVILRNIDEVYTEIDRTFNDFLEVSYKAEDNIRRYYGLPYKHLFQFIARRRKI